MISSQTKPAPAAKPLDPSTTRRILIDTMAEAMREMAHAGETVSVDTLRARGFTEASIARYGSEATTLAARRSIRQVASPEEAA